MGARNDRAPHEPLKEVPDNLFLKQRKCPGIDAGAEFTEDQLSGGLGAGPDPPSLMVLRYEVANKHSGRFRAVPAHTRGHRSHARRRHDETARYPFVTVALNGRDIDAAMVTTVGRFRYTSRVRNEFSNGITLLLH